MPRLQTINFLLPYSKAPDYMSAVPKTRPPMTDDQLAKLAVAREKALAVRRAQKVEKLKAEAARLEAPSEELRPSVEPVNTGDDPPPTPAPSLPASPTPQPPEVEQAPKPRSKKKAAKQADPVVVVEQSSDDEDTFEAPPGVIFVKRRRTKPKAEPKAEPPPPPPSAEEVAVDYAYRRMVNGEFHMGHRR